MDARDSLHRLSLSAAAAALLVGCISVTPSETVPVGSAPASASPGALVAGGVTPSPVGPTTAPASDQIPTATPTAAVPTSTPTRQPTPTPTDAPTLPPPPSATPTIQPTPTISADGACGDPTYELSGDHWDTTYEWYFNAASVPDRYDADEVLEIVKRSVENMTSAANDCGLPDLVDAEAAYMGTTEYSPCDADSPAISIVGFARLRGDAIGESCPYTTTTGDMVVDVEIDTETNWALDADACSGDQEILEATLTHEFGHVFGLDDVRERAHGDLTMSSRSNGPCTTEEISLGLGDVLGLQELY